MKLLVIPSWYPTKNYPQLGIFFKDQAALVSDKLDVKVLYGTENLVGRKKFLIKLLHLSFLSEVREINENINSIPTEVTFEYDLPVFFKSKIVLQKIVEAYKVAFNAFDGWYPDVIHAQDAYPAGIIAKSLAEKLNIPYLITQHSPLLYHKFDSYQRLLIKSAFEEATKVLAVSNFSARNLLMLGFNFNPTIIGNYINENQFPLKANYLRDDKENYKIFFMCNLSRHKDIPTFLKAISKVIDLGYSNLVITMQLGDFFSDGITIADVYHYIKRNNIESKFNVRNNMSRGEMVEAYQQSDVFVSTSYYETFGMVVCEAMSCGTPVVSVKNGGVEDILTQENGILVDMMDSSAVAQAIVEVISKKYTFKAEDVRNSIINKFGTEVFRERLLTAYFEAINQTK